jgi:hypothetical protein
LAFVVQCPFCQQRAKVPDRAIGGLARCPKCASSFTLASVDDQHLPESATATEPIPAANVDAAIAVASASAAADDAMAAAVIAQHAPPVGFQPAAALGGLALVLSGVALIGGSISTLYAFVLPLAGLGLLTGLAAIVMTCLAARRRLLLPVLGSAAAAVILVVAWLAPGLLGPAYEYVRQGPPTKSDRPEIRKK